ALPLHDALPIFRKIFCKFCAKKSFIRSVLKQTADEIGHSGQKFTHRGIFADTITHFDEGPFDWPAHAVEQLKLETASIDTEFIRKGLGVRNAAHIMRAERRNIRRAS